MAHHAKKVEKNHERVGRRGREQAAGTNLIEQDTGPNTRDADLPAGPSSKKRK